MYLATRQDTTYKNWIDIMREKCLKFPLFYLANEEILHKKEQENYKNM